MIRSKEGLSISERLERLSIPVPECGCFIWLGSIKKNNSYGCFRIKRKTKLAHRVSWEIANGKIPKGMNVLHSCDTPSCINPDHLFLGTQQENIADMKKKNRCANGEKLPQSKLTTEDIKAIRISNLSGRELSKLFNVSEGNISMIRSKKSWAWL